MWARISGMEDAGPCQPGPRGFEKDEVWLPHVIETFELTVGSNQG